jgi:PadR family transcriptional regulator, regulatory protein PadR
MPPRVTPQTQQVPLALSERLDADHYGLDLMKRTGLLSVTLYPALIWLEGHGVVRSTWEDVNASYVGRPRRRLYRLTADGLRQRLETRHAVLP